MRRRICQSFGGNFSTFRQEKIPRPFVVPTFYRCTHLPSLHLSPFVAPISLRCTYRPSLFLSPFVTPISLRCTFPSSSRQDSKNSSVQIKLVDLHAALLYFFVDICVSGTPPSNAVMLGCSFLSAPAFDQANGDSNARNSQDFQSRRHMPPRQP